MTRKLSEPDKHNVFAIVNRNAQDLDQSILFNSNSSSQSYLIGKNAIKKINININNISKSIQIGTEDDDECNGDDEMNKDNDEMSCILNIKKEIQTYGSTFQVIKSNNEILEKFNSSLSDNNEQLANKNIRF
jgi:hypothetical protein